MLKDAASCSKLLFLSLLPQPLQHALLYELLAVCFFSPNTDSAQWAHYRPTLTRFSPPRGSLRFTAARTLTPVFFFFSSALLCPSEPSETRGSAECDAADGYVDRSGVRDEVPDWNGLRPQAAGCTQGEGGLAMRACPQPEEETLIFFDWAYLRRCWAGHGTVHYQRLFLSLV